VVIGNRNTRGSITIGFGLLIRYSFVTSAHRVDSLRGVLVVIRDGGIHDKAMTGAVWLQMTHASEYSVHCFQSDLDLDPHRRLLPGYERRC